MKRSLLLYWKSLIFITICLGCADIAKGQVPSTAAAYPFTATTEPFVYVTGGTSVSLAGDDACVQSIPLGFTFPFAGGNYTTVSASTNGWLSLGNIYSSNWTNSQSSVASITPTIFPLFDDHYATTASFAYVTTGTAPNRVFTFEWKKLDWPRFSSYESITFQAKLFENGMIKFCYKQEPPAMNSGASASIGIAKTSSDYLTLNNASASPTASSTTFTDVISTRPATDQVYIFGAPPCLYAPVSATATNITSSKATLNWSHSVNGAPPMGYEIVIDQTAGAPAGAVTSITGTSYTATGLTPGTSYYAHIRGRCSALGASNWVNIPFTTTICIAPKVSMANITHNSALALWNSLPPAINYQYIVNTTGIPPTSDLGAGNTTSNSAQLTGLDPDTHYYLYMRTQCTNNETSDWEATEFTTMVECLAPDVMIISTYPDGHATWNEVPTSVAYEYAINSFPTPPSLGTIIYSNDLEFNIPNDGKPYYLHIRTKCISIFTSSEWTTVTLREPTGISNVNSNNNLLLMAYPNPAKDMITVDLNGLQSNTGTIMLTDITGKILYTTNATTASLNIDMSNMPAGIYMIKYIDKEQNQVLKITKQ